MNCFTLACLLVCFHPTRWRGIENWKVNKSFCDECILVLLFVILLTDDGHYWSLFGKFTLFISSSQWRAIFLTQHLHNKKFQFPLDQFQITCSFVMPKSIKRKQDKQFEISMKWCGIISCFLFEENFCNDDNFFLLHLKTGFCVVLLGKVWVIKTFIHSAEC